MDKDEEKTVNNYVIAATFIKQDIGGIIDIQTVLDGYRTATIEEAIGKFILDYSKDFPDHNLFKRPVAMEVKSV